MFDDLDRWSVAVRVLNTACHFPPVVHFWPDCFGPWPAPLSLGGVSFGSCGLPPLAMTVLLRIETTNVDFRLP